MKWILGMACLLAVSMGVTAAPVTWYVDDIEFTDGGVVTGFFDYDAANNTFTNIAITTTAGTIRSGSSYSNPTDIGNATIADFIDPDLPVVPNQSERLVLYPSAAMTDAGGTITLLLVHEFTCIDFGCSFLTGNEPGLDLRVSRTGFVTTVAAVPEPATLALLGIGLAGLGFSRCKRAFN